MNGTKPANPSGLNATNMDNGGALLKWPAAPGAVTYNIKRATTPGGPFQKIAQIAASPDATIIEYTDATNLTDGQDYYYVISASNAYGESFDSAHARVDISNAAAPQITTQPLSQNTECGASVTLSVTTPESGVTYQWLKDGQTIAGATSATLTLAGIPADSGSYQVRITGQNGVTLSTAATLTIVPSQTGAHGTPAALTVDASGIVYVSDEEKNVIHTLTPPGSTNVYVNVFAGAPGESGALDGTGTNARLNRPVGITVRSGTLYVADSGNARLRTISAGREVKTHPAIISGELTAIAIDPAGNIYAADKSAHVIRKIEAATGNPVIVAGQLNTSGTLDGSGTAAQFNAPAGIAHAAGILYVADTGNHTIRKIDLAHNNSVATHAGCATVHGSVDGHRDDALFNQPEGLIVDGDGTLYVADTGNSTIREITAGGYVNTLAGNPGADGVTGIAGFKDATGTNALFNHPRDLALGNNGEYLYVADSGNRAIRRIDSTNKVQTMTAIVSSGTSTNPEQPENPDNGNKGGGGGGGAPRHGISPPHSRCSPQNCAKRNNPRPPIPL
ncbi:SMP-30/gluconolactonase/LRE family protein [Ereboglobus luteus]|uniref:Ig-like domain-containing protein n=1 Tax=Ereboglobus luteus TaxID=1796921 RepID=A0A2U8E4H9_9BACT|nr:SMP-30/gluconolactonase/LRE family protein [Ereboglobus luteus]AWI09454.1 hypothetical protein CKA38_09535 [Ereboglobus luteus]